VVFAAVVPGRRYFRDGRDRRHMAVGEKFPEIAATTLAGTEKVLPGDLAGTVALIVIAFERQAQAMIDSWTDPLAPDFPEGSGFFVFEVPMIDSPVWRMMGGMIDSGMRSGIPPRRHGFVMTYYGGTETYRRTLAMDDRSLAYLFLLDREGRIRWEARGFATPGGVRELMGKIRELLGKE
jgi:hypothetical protein